MKLAGVVIAYNCTDAELYENVKCYIDCVEHMIIWNNTPCQQHNSSIDFWSNKHPNVVLLGTGKNEGIGFALNRAIEYAIKQNCTHLLTMDQDSVWRDFQLYREKIENDNDEKIAIYAPTIADAEIDFEYCCNKPDLYAITSGSVLNLKYIETIGFFNEKFFIDEVDNEYCVRTVLNGFHIKVYDDIFLYQHFGYKNGQSFLARQTANYSAFRTYHQVRNRIWMWRMYPKQLNYRYHLRTILMTILKRSIIVTVYEKDKWNKLKAIVKGINDGLVKKMDQ